MFRAGLQSVMMASDDMHNTLQLLLNPVIKEAQSSTHPVHHWKPSCKNNGVWLSPAICPLWCVTPSPLLLTNDMQRLTEKEVARKSRMIEGGVNRVRLLYNHIWEAVITAWAHRQLHPGVPPTLQQSETLLPFTMLVCRLHLKVVLKTAHPWLLTGVLWKSRSLCAINN